MNWFKKHSQTEKATEILKQLRTVSSLLRELGFEVAADDVTAQNLHRYANWILQTIKSEMTRTDPVTRERFVAPEWKKKLDQTEKLFTQLGIKPVPGEYWRSL